MTSSHTLSKTPSSASRTAARARMRARAAANAASKPSAKESDRDQPPALPKGEEHDNAFHSSPPAPVASSSKNHDQDFYPSFHTHVGRSNTDSTDLLGSLSNSNQVSDSYPHVWTTREISEAERIPLEADPPLVFRTPSVLAKSRVALPAVHTRQKADPVMLTPRPRVKLSNELEECDEENSERLSDSELDSPYVPGPDAENNLRCLKWLKNIGRSRGDSEMGERKRS